MKNFDVHNNNRGTLKYKAVTTPDGETKIEAVFELEPASCLGPTTIDQTWYDLGDGQHVREDQLEKLTQPYGGDSAEVRTDG
jgi:hypothetical protein